jgi:hypothetical protein
MVVTYRPTLSEHPRQAPQGSYDPTTDGRHPPEGSPYPLGASSAGATGLRRSPGRWSSPAGGLALPPRSILGRRRRAPSIPRTMVVTCRRARPTPSKHSRQALQGSHDPTTMVVNCRRARSGDVIDRGRGSCLHDRPASSSTTWAGPTCLQALRPRCGQVRLARKIWAGGKRQRQDPVTGKTFRQSAWVGCTRNAGPWQVRESKGRRGVSRETTAVPSSPRHRMVGTASREQAQPSTTFAPASDRPESSSTVLQECPTCLQALRPHWGQVRLPREIWGGRQAQPSTMFGPASDRPASSSTVLQECPKGPTHRSDPRWLACSIGLQALRPHCEQVRLARKIWADGKRQRPGPPREGPFANRLGWGAPAALDRGRCESPRGVEVFHVKQPSCPRRAIGGWAPLLENEAQPSTTFGSRPVLENEAQPSTTFAPASDRSASSSTVLLECPTCRHAGPTPVAGMFDRPASSSGMFDRRTPSL